uniref:Serine/arginine repetitive matrix protein 2 n=1 Tax=Panagrellus redivivus TaxID=6233 RepID=A0A7E4VWB4_PANRE
MQYGSTPKSQKERKKKDALRRKGSSRRRGGDSDRYSDRQRRSTHGGNAARRKRSTTGTKHPPRSTRQPRRALSVPRVLDTQDSKSRLNSKFELPPQRKASSQQPSSDKEDIGQDRGGGRDQHRQSNPAPAQGPGQVIESDDHYVQFVPLANQQNAPAPAIQPQPALAQTQDPNEDYGGSPAANPAPDPPAAGGNENYANLDVPVGALPPPPPPSPPPPPPPPPQHREQGSSRRKKKKQDRRRR